MPGGVRLRTAASGPAAPRTAAGTASVTSRERVTAAINHRQPDRLPVDLGGSIVTGINAVAYANLKRFLSARGWNFASDAVKVTNIILLLAEVEPEVIEAWGIDVLPIDRYYAAPGVPLSGRWNNHPLPDGSPALFPAGFEPLIEQDGTWKLFEGEVMTNILSPGSGSFVPAHFPLADISAGNLRELESYPLPRISREELEYLRKRARELYENTDKALFGWFNGSIFETGQYLSGFDTFFMRLAGEPEFSRRLLERLTEAVIADLKLYLEAVGEYIQVIGFGDDLGFQNGPQIDPRLFRSLVKPLLREIYGTAHSLSPAKVFLHSCGSVYEFIEDFIEIGVDILNPVQTSAARMDAGALKELFGGRIAFWGGGADAQNVLPRGTPQEVRRDVSRRIEVMEPGGGFVFAPIHNLQPDIPPQNIAAMYEEATGG
jgi:uroporphyrinogen decarboxylase